MLALDFLRVPLAWSVLFRLEVTRVGAPVIGIILCNPKGVEQGFQLQKHRILPPPKDIGQDFSRVVIDRMPEPAWVPFVPDKRPHLIHLRFASLRNIHGNVLWVQRAEQRGVHRLQGRFFLLSSRSTVLGQICRERAVSRTPLALRLMSMIVCLTSGKHPRLQESSRKLPLAQRVFWQR